MREIKKYEVFKKAHKLALEVYKLTASFPKHELFSLVGQMRRAAYSIPMNLAEGSARDSEKEFAQSVNIAIGSCEEVRYQLLLSKDLSYLNGSEYSSLEKEYESVERMLASLYKKLRS